MLGFLSLYHKSKRITQFTDELSLTLWVCTQSRIWVYTLTQDIQHFCEFNTAPGWCYKWSRLTKIVLESIYLRVRIRWIRCSCFLMDAKLSYDIWIPLSQWESGLPWLGDYYIYTIFYWQNRNVEIESPTHSGGVNKETSPDACNFPQFCQVGYRISIKLMKWYLLTVGKYGLIIAIPLRLVVLVLSIF